MAPWLWLEYLGGWKGGRVNRRMGVGAMNKYLADPVGRSIRCFGDYEEYIQTRKAIPALKEFVEETVISKAN